MPISPCSDKIIVEQNELANVVPIVGDGERESVHQPQCVGEMKESGVVPRSTFRC